MEVANTPALTLVVAIAFMIAAVTVPEVAVITANMRVVIIAEGDANKTVQDHAKVTAIKVAKIHVEEDVNILAEVIAQTAVNSSLN